MESYSYTNFSKRIFKTSTNQIGKSMRILKIVLLIVGVVLVVLGLYNAFVPQQVLDIGPLEVNAKEGLTNQTLGMIGIGVLALIAGTLLKNRR